MLHRRETAPAVHAISRILDPRPRMLGSHLTKLSLQGTGVDRQFRREAAPRGGLMRGRLKRYRRRQPAVCVVPVEISSLEEQVGGRRSVARTELRPRADLSARTERLPRGGGRQQVSPLVERVADVILDPTNAMFSGAPFGCLRTLGQEDHPDRRVSLSISERRRRSLRCDLLAAGEPRCDFLLDGRSGFQRLVAGACAVRPRQVIGRSEAARRCAMASQTVRRASRGTRAPDGVVAGQGGGRWLGATRAERLSRSS